MTDHVLPSTPDHDGVWRCLNCREVTVPFTEDRCDPRCPVCADHPGWAHDDPRGRSEPDDVCKACLGGGVKRPLGDLNPRLLARLSQRYSSRIVEALDDEAEGAMHLNVLRLANVAATLKYLVATW